MKKKNFFQLKKVYGKWVVTTTFRDTDMEQVIFTGTRFQCCKWISEANKEEMMEQEMMERNQN